MSAKCKKVDEAVISSPDFVSISPFIKNNGNVLKMSRTSNLIPVVTDIFGEASIMDCITNRSHFARKDYLEIDLQLSNAEAFGNLSENMDVIDVHLYKFSSSYQQENTFLSNLDMIEKETDRTMLRIRLLIMEASKLSNSLKSITVEYSNLIERIQEDCKCCEPPLVVFINNKYGNDRAENEIVTLHGSQEGMMSPRKVMDNHTCIVQDVSFAFDDGGMNKEKSCAEELRKVSKERPWMAGVTELLLWIMISLFTSGKRLFLAVTQWLIWKMTFFTRGKQLSQVLVLFLLCVHGVSSKCSFKNNYIGLDQLMSNSTLIIDICYDKMECSQENFRWDKNHHQIYLGPVKEWEYMKYSIHPIPNSTCVEMKIHNIMPDDLRSLHTFTLKYWPIRVSPEIQPIPVGQPFIVCNESRGLPMLTSMLKHDGSQDLSKTIKVFSEKQGKVEQINSTVNVENGNISVVINDDLSSCYIMVIYPYQGHEFKLMGIYLTKKDIEMCAAKPITTTAMTGKNELNVGVVVGVCFGVALFITAIIAVIIWKKRWCGTKQYENTSFISLFYLCKNRKRDDQDGRNGEKERMKQSRDDILI